jgi:hypothetical protein
MLTSPGFELAQKECAKLGLELAGYAPTSTATAAEMAQALAVAKCMRAHGVPNWPKRSRQRGQCHGESERGSNCDTAGMAGAKETSCVDRRRSAGGTRRLEHDQAGWRTATLGAPWA